MQNQPKSRIPTWLAALILSVFVGHYAIVFLNHFSKDLLPKKYYYATNEYLVPWFYQNLTAFAPEPAYLRHVIVFRNYRDGNWTNWVQPGYSYQEKSWKNRLSNAVKMADMIDYLGEYMYAEAKRAPEDQKLITWAGNSYVLNSCLQFLEYQDPTAMKADSIQFGLYLSEHHTRNHRLTVQDTAFLFKPIQPSAWK